MTTLNKQFWDRHLPDSPETIRRAEALTGLDLSKDLLGVGLRWLADQTEIEAKPRWGDDTPEWHKPGGEDVLGPDWSISASGLSYKPWSNYLTLEGYPTGTTCWYVRIDAGWREMVCGETPELALVRGLIVFATAQKQRPTAPRKRRELHEELASPVAPPPP